MTTLSDFMATYFENDDAVTRGLVADYLNRLVAEEAHGVAVGAHSLLVEAMEWIAIVAITGAKSEDAVRWLQEHDDGRGDWVFR